MAAQTEISESARKIHPRQRIVAEARSELIRMIQEWSERHDGLSYGELLSVIGGVLGSEVTSLAKYLIREERHPDDPDKPGGLE